MWGDLWVNCDGFLDVDDNQQFPSLLMLTPRYLLVCMTTLPGVIGRVAGSGRLLHLPLSLDVDSVEVAWSLYIRTLFGGQNIHLEENKGMQTEADSK